MTDRKEMQTGDPRKGGDDSRLRGGKLSAAKAGLSRELGLIGAIACGVGPVIGSGIFKKPGLMAAQLGAPELLILIWIVAGVVTLFGALSIAEISGMFRDPGGQYIYFNKGYNRCVGYL